MIVWALSRKATGATGSSGVNVGSKSDFAEL